MKSLFVVLISLFSLNAFAGSAGYGYLAGISPGATGAMVFYTNGARSGAPACAKEQARFVVNGATPGGKVVVATVLAAFLAGKRVLIVGTGACDLLGDTETINYLITE